MRRLARQRTWFTTLLGWATILLAGLGSIFSLFALLLAIGKPYANASTTFLDIFLLFILPPATLLAGIGLLPRWRWARWWMIFLMAGLVVLGVKGLLDPDHAGAAYAPQPGPAADAATQARIVRSVACSVTGGLVLLGLFSGPVRGEFGKPQPPPPPVLSPLTAQNGPPPSPQDEQLGWRVGHWGRDMMFYEERQDARWRRIEIDGELLAGRAHHAIYFANAETWRLYPEWARHRRDEIIARIKSRFREPDYEYADNGAAPAARPDPVAAIPRPDGTILPMLAVLLAVAAASIWFSWRGLESGETRLPARYSQTRRAITRAEDPALFWTSITLTGGLGGACLIFSAWLIRSRPQGRPSR